MIPHAVCALGHSFPRACRLTTPQEYRRVFARPCRMSGPNFVLLARRNELGHARLGLAIAKKHAKAAVSRNRVKRQVRESFRHRRDELGSLDFIFLGRPGLGMTDLHQVRRALDRLWSSLAEQCARY